MVQLIDLYRTSRHLNCEHAVFLNGFDLVSALEKGKRFDIYCLDIMMSGFTGIDAAKEIRTFDKTAPILFFTSSAEFALESYSVKAINYLLKPITKEKLFFAFDELMEQVKVKKDEDAVIVKSHVGIQKILVSNLVFAEVIGRNVLYHLASGKVIECTEPFSSVCDNLNKYGCFIKPHRSYLVNMQYVDTIGNHQINLQTLSSIPVAQGKAKEIKLQYLNYQMEGE
jgi:DNA-binding LytR/AlgR family response regulator